MGTSNAHADGFFCCGENWVIPHGGYGQRYSWFQIFIFFWKTISPRFCDFRPNYRGHQAQEWVYFRGLSIHKWRMEEPNRPICEPQCYPAPIPAGTLWEQYLWSRSDAVSVRCSEEFRNAPNATKSVSSILHRWWTWQTKSGTSFYRDSQNQLLSFPSLYLLKGTKMCVLVYLFPYLII